MKKIMQRSMRFALVFCLLLSAVAALAANPEPATKRYRLNVVYVTGKSIPLYAEATEKSTVIATFTTSNELTYLGKEKGFYQIAMFYNNNFRIGYIPIQSGVTVKRVVRNTSVFPAGEYRVDMLGRSESGDILNGIFSPGLYYAAADKQKTGTVVVSKQPNGVDPIDSFNFQEGTLFLVEKDAYVTAKDCTLRNPKFAPQKYLRDYAAANKAAVSSAILPPGSTWNPPDDFNPVGPDLIILQPAS